MKPETPAPAPPPPLRVEPAPSAGWEEWHHKQHNPRGDGTHEEPQAFIPGLGTVRECIDCGCLVAGGPTRCKRCVREVESASHEPAARALCRELRKWVDECVAEADRGSGHHPLWIEVFRTKLGALEHDLLGEEGGYRGPTLEPLLRRAWCRLGECVCHGEPGSKDHAEMKMLMDDIDAALPLVRNPVGEDR